MNGFCVTVFLIVGMFQSRHNDGPWALFAVAGVFALLGIADELRALVKLRREERPVSHTYNVANK